MGKGKSMASEEHIQELLQAEKEGRLVVLPVRLGSPVYTVIEDYFACEKCKYKNEASYDSVLKQLTCNPPKGRLCPYIVKETLVEGFEIRQDDDGNTILSKPGTWTWEGLQEVYSDTNIWYTSREEAEKAAEEQNKT